MLPLCDMHCDTAMAIWHEHKSLAKNDLNIDLEKAAVFSKSLPYSERPALAGLALFF